MVLEALPALLEDGIQFALLGDGDSGYEERFRQLGVDNPGRVAIEIGYDERLAHRLLAGADMLVHPSRFEPCGLVPIYAMRYGTIPLVCRSGGMADTVTEATADTILGETATGFSAEDTSMAAVIDSVRRAHASYRQPIAWRKLQTSAMRQDFSWRRSAEAYADIYKSLIAPPLESRETTHSERRARVTA
jgi:starch synthase